MSHHLRLMPSPYLWYILEGSLQLAHLNSISVSFSQGSPNSSTSCSVPNLSYTPIHSIHRLTPVASLRTSRSKRPALGSIPSFSAVDLSHYGT